MVGVNRVQFIKKTQQFSEEVSPCVGTRHKEEAQASSATVMSSSRSSVAALYSTYVDLNLCVPVNSFPLLELDNEPI